MLCTSKDFIKDQLANKKLEKIRNPKNIIFMSTSLTPNEYFEILNFFTDEK